MHKRKEIRKIDYLLELVGFSIFEKCIIILMDQRMYMDSFPKTERVSFRDVLYRYSSTISLWQVYFRKQLTYVIECDFYYTYQGMIVLYCGQDYSFIMTIFDQVYIERFWCSAHVNFLSLLKVVYLFILKCFENIF